MKSSQYIFHILIAYSLLLSSVYALNVDQEERANNLFKETRCLVCEGQNIYESNSDSAEDMKKLISEMIIDGKSDNEIKSFLVSRYGDWIIMTPPINQSTYFLWFSPIIILFFGIVFILRKFKKNG